MAGERSHWLSRVAGPTDRIRLHPEFELQLKTNNYYVNTIAKNRYICN